MDANFEESPPVQTDAIRQDTALREHIDDLWPKLVRSQTHVPPYSSLLALPHPYVVPGGASARCITGIPTSPCSAW